MPRFLRTRKATKGLPPGSLNIAVSEEIEKVKIRVINYNEQHFDESEVSTIDDCLYDAKSKDKVTWIHIEGLSNKIVLESIGKLFNVHSLWLEDVLNTDHRPKMEELDNLIFCIIKAVEYKKRKKEQIYFEQTSFFLGDNFILSFQESNRPIFNNVYQRIKEDIGKIRKFQADYLFYTLVDCVVDEYFHVLEILGEKVEQLEEKIEKKFEEEIYGEISRLKTELVYLRKSALPIRDVLGQCYYSDREEFDVSTKKYLKDALDHAVQVVEVIDTYKEMIFSAKDSYRTAQTNKMNEIMKTLTIFASIFIPLTFIVGIYGMNFEYMPEIKWRYGYAFSWVLMGSVGGGLIAYFKLKKWV